MDIHVQAETETALKHHFSLNKKPKHMEMSFQEEYNWSFTLMSEEEHQWSFTALEKPNSKY